MDNKFKIEEQYRLYLERVGQKEENMHPQQKKQLKEVFFGAWGQALISLREDLAPLPEEEAAGILEAQIKEVGNFFLKARDRQN